MEGWVLGNGMVRVAVCWSSEFGVKILDILEWNLKLSL